MMPSKLKLWVDAKTVWLNYENIVRAKSRVVSGPVPSAVAF